MRRKICNLIPRHWILVLYSNQSTDPLFSWNPRPYEATNHNRSEAVNASRGLAARATSYSRYSSRTGSADVAKSSKEGAVAVIALDSKAVNNSFYRNNSGGRARSLHLTSVENPFVEQVVTVPIAAQEQQEQWVALKVGSLSTRVFETWPRRATGSELISVLTCLHTTTFTLQSLFSPLEMSSIKIWETIRS